MVATGHALTYGCAVGNCRLAALLLIGLEGKRGKTLPSNSTGWYNILCLMSFPQGAQVRSQN